MQRRTTGKDAAAAVDAENTREIHANNGNVSLRRWRHPITNGVYHQQHKNNNNVESIINLLMDNVGLGCLLLIVFTSWLAVSFVIYQRFDASPGTTPTLSTLLVHPGIIMQQHSTSVNVERRRDIINAHSTPTKHPAIPPTTVTQQEQTGTFEPTAHNKVWRLKEAKKRSNENSAYWKTNIPDPIPPIEDDNDESLPPVIAYVTTLTKCGPKHRGGLDGAAVLLHSIRRNSYGWTPIDDEMLKDNSIYSKKLQQHNNQNSNTKTTRPQYGGQGGKYRYRAYVIVDPIASPQHKQKSGDCARYLQKIGWTILHRPPLVPLFPINITIGGNATSETFEQLLQSGYMGINRPQTGPTALRKGERSDKLRLMMHNDGCCGYTELLKLHVYGLIEHKLAVHLDFDSLLLRPMDDLFDAMLGVGDVSKLSMANLPQTREVDLSKPIDAAFTRDYNSVNTPSNPLTVPIGYQGGFLVVRPSSLVLDRYRTEILQRGEFVLGPRDGWGAKHGGFYGDVTFQGILPYYYEDIAPKGEHNEVELDRCIYNQMADNPRKSTYKFPRATPLDPDKMGFKDTKFCRDGRKDCSDTDCQRTHPKDSITTHFTFCKKVSEFNMETGTVVHFY